MATGETSPARKALTHVARLATAERLRAVAGEGGTSESHVIQLALTEFFASGDETALGERVRAHAMHHPLD